MVPENVFHPFRMGFLVIDEVYDKWAMPWQPLWAPSANVSRKAFAAEFHANWKQDLRDFISRDRNHPSVVIWSVGNETMEQLKDPESGALILDSLVQFIHAFEPGRKVTCGLHPGNASQGDEAPSRFIHGMQVGHSHDAGISQAVRLFHTEHLFRKTDGPYRGPGRFPHP